MLTNLQDIKHHYKILLVCGLAVFMVACGSTSRNTHQPILVGPAAPELETQTQNPDLARLQNAEQFLDLAVPVFEPGFPMLDNGRDIDYAEMDEQGIWPQLRRTEAKLFALETKNSLESTAAFSSVRVVPDANTTADVFVLGKILTSTSEDVGMELTIVAANGKVLGQRKFEHKVDENYFKDQRNTGLNPYQPMYDEGRDYVLAVLSRLSDEQKAAIKDVSLVRYARYYSPQNYAKYIETSVKRKSGQSYYQFSLKGMPSEDDMNLQRIKELRAQELLFVDRLQDNYDTFYAETKDAYATWQRETLPEIFAYREAQRDRNIKAGLGVGLAILAGVLASNDENSNSSLGRGATAAGAVLAGVGSAIAITDAFKSNAELKVQSAIIEEKGQAVDLTLSPTEMQFADQIIELKGNAQEQYMQWKQHLREMYELEKTPNIQL